MENKSEFNLDSFEVKELDHVQLTEIEGGTPFLEKFGAFLHNMFCTDHNANYAQAVTVAGSVAL